MGVCLPVLLDITYLKNKAMVARQVGTGGHDQRELLFAIKAAKRCHIS
jgi:hypothetical protein